MGWNYLSIPKLQRWFLILIDIAQFIAPLHVQGLAICDANNCFSETQMIRFVIIIVDDDELNMCLVIAFVPLQKLCLLDDVPIYDVQDEHLIQHYGIR